MSNTCTINGRPFADCLKEIREYKKKSKSKDMGNGKSYGYYAIDEYIQRLDDVIGTDHYEVETDDFQKVTVSSGQEMFVVRCRITIIDDEGRRIVSKTAYGGSEIQYAKQGGRTDMGNLPGNACKDAFKAAAELFGILGYHGYKEAENRPVSSESKPAPEQKEPKKDVPMNLRSEGKFFEAGVRDGRTIWKLGARERVNAKQMRSEVYEIIYYPNQYGKDAEKFNAFFARVDRKATDFKAIVQACGTKDGKAQYIFKGFAAN